MRRNTLTAIAAIAALLTLTGCSIDTASATENTQTSFSWPWSKPTTTPTPTTTPAPTSTTAATVKSGTALALLNTLPVKGKAPKTGYTRTQFGQAWLDADRNGCDTRNDILARDLTNETMSGRCKVLTGTLARDAYTNKTINFVRAGEYANSLDVDHVVPLGLGWITGMQGKDKQVRAAYANDPLNLIAVDPSANRQKSDSDAASWLPANKAYRCTYVATQVAVKAKYGMWVTQPEKDAITRVLNTCPTQKAPTGGISPRVTFPVR